MTLVSRPVLAAQCQSPSAFCSGNASVAAGAGPICTGRTPGYWKHPQHFGSWTPPYYPTTVGYYATTVGSPGGHKATLFDAVFTPHYSGKTLLEVLEMGGGPPNDVARHVVAALLNAAAGLTPVLTIAAVQGIWTEYISKGYFEPTAGVHWGDAQIVSYLVSMMA